MIILFYLFVILWAFIQVIQLVFKLIYYLIPAIVIVLIVSFMSGYFAYLMLACWIVYIMLFRNRQNKREEKPAG
jgi:hypothetical protein